jgi:argininosuccinate lyase
VPNEPSQNPTSATAAPATATEPTNAAESVVRPADATGNTLWAGRFTESTDAFVQAFTASVSFDRRLYRHDIKGSVAHATMLAHVGVLSEAERDQIIDGLGAIEADISAGTFTWSVALEDVHMNVESALTARIGDVGKKLHTGRSRNDQVATDMRLYIREENDNLAAAVARLQAVLIDLAEREADTILPGFTHLQAAQPVTFGHHMLAWQEMLSRDRERLLDARKRINRSPLGAAALAGTSFPIDREYTAELLGFDGVCENSLDAVSDRDFVLELLSTCSTLVMHLSRMAEELVLWCSSQFDFIELGDAFCTGSSIMPQKKNPDVAELVRGKSGRVIGHLMGMLILMKGQPLTYNKDNQEDKEPAFDTIDTVKDCLRAFADMLPSMTVKRDKTHESARLGFATATDLADYLVRAGLAFRDAHEIVGKAVRFALDQGKDLSELSLDELQALSALIREDVYEVLTLEGSVAARNHIGGTAPNQVRAAVIRARARLGAET